MNMPCASMPVSAMKPDCLPLRRIMPRRIFFLVLLSALFLFPELRAGDENRLISLYPVPLKGSILSVRLNAPNSAVAGAELRNLIGKKLQEKNFPKGGNELVFEEMDTYPNGIYVVLAKDAYGKIVEIAKFTINR
jgi:hypothetical protein